MEHPVVRTSGRATPAEPRLGEWLAEGWKLYRAEPGPLILLSLIFLGAMALLSKTVIGPALLSGPLLCGLFYVILEKLQGRPMHVGDLAKGFGVFVQALLASLVTGLFTAMGFICLVLPGFVVAAMYMFTFPLVIDRKLDFWTAMETSRKAVWPRIAGFTLAFVALGVIAVSGALLLGVGAILTFPLAICAQAVAYRQVFGIAGEGDAEPARPE